MLAAYFGNGEDLAGLRRRCGVSLTGATLDAVMRACSSVQLSTRAVRCRLSELRRLRTPCILHWELNHFVVLRKVAGDGLVIHDPAQGRVHAPMNAADRKFTGIALEVTPAPGFRREKPLRQLHLGDLLSIDRTFLGSVSAVLLFAFLSELMLLAMPLYLQTVIDQVLIRGDQPLLNTLVMAFGLLLAFQLLASAMRQLTTQFLSQATVFRLASRVLRHLLHLPVAWFRARRLGDIQQRMQSLATIQAFITQSAPTLAVDTVFLVIVSGLMFAYAPALTLGAMAVAGLYVLWRLAIFRATLEQANTVVRAEAAAQTHLLESLRAAQSIRMLAGETRRTAEWQNLFVRRVNAQIRMGNLQIADGTIRQALFQALHLGVVFLLAQEVMTGNMSIGSLSAFVAYTGMFVTRVGGIINRLFEYRLLRVPLDRLADLVFHEAESAGEAAEYSGTFNGALRSRDLAFTYAGSERPIFQNVSFEVSSGDFIVIRGRSGSGKSTLLRVLAAMEKPTSGTLCYDGRPAADWPPAMIRRGIATVFQDDAPLSGSIAANIALFDPAPDRERIREAAACAMIDAEIEALPMGYETLVGDLGSALSTGQLQRILFARAVYRRPRLLLLDEFTSGLDEENERQVIASLLRLPATRIVVTHSLLVMRAADRVLDLGDLQRPIASQRSLARNQPVSERRGSSA